MLIFFQGNKGTGTPLGGPHDWNTGKTKMGVSQEKEE